MLLELDDRRLVDDHEVDVLRACCLSVATSLFSGCLAVELIDGCVESALWNLNYTRELVEHCPALICLHVSHETEKCRSDEEITLRSRNLVVIHAISCCGDGCDYIGTSGKSCSGSCADAGKSSVSCEAESVELRYYLCADELASESSEGHACGLDVVHAVDCEHSASVEVALHCLHLESHIALNVAGALGVVSEAVHAHLGDEELVCVCALLHEIVRAVEDCCE